MFKTLKKILRFLKRCKFLVVVSLIMLLLNQILGFLSPLIVKEILDEHIIGIEQPWYKVDNQDDTTVLFNGSYYKQEKNFDDYDVIHKTDVASIFLYNNSFYFVEGDIEEGTRKLDEKSNVLTVNSKGIIYIYEDVVKLTAQNVTAFYQPSVKILTILIGILFLRALLSIIFGYIQRITTEQTNVRIVHAARSEAAMKISRLPMSYFEGEPAGKTSARITHDVNGLMELYRAVVNIVLYAGLSFVTAYVGMFYLDYRLALLSFFAFPLILLWIKYFSKTLNKIATKVNEFRSQIVASINEIINGISILQIFNYKKPTIERFNKLSKSYMNEQLEEVKLHTSLGWNMINLIRGFITALVVLYFGWNKVYFGDLVISAGLIYAYNEKGELFHFGVVNPKIISESTELTFLPTGEGCLSVDRDVEGLVHRPKRITAKFHKYDFKTKKLEEVTMKFENYIAIVFQHEYDHLNGIMFMDRIDKINPFFVPENSKPILFAGEDTEE